MTKVYLVRHAQSDHQIQDERERPLTPEGLRDTFLVLETLKDRNIEIIYSSPYRRAQQTVASTARELCLPILTDERFRERVPGQQDDYQALFVKRWQDLTFHEPGGESLRMVQERNIEALTELLHRYENGNIVIATHGYAMASILQYYQPDFGYDDFMRMIDFMPYIVELDFDKTQLLNIQELAYLDKK